MAVDAIEVLVIHEKQYLKYRDALRYLHCTENTLAKYVFHKMLHVVRVESARLFELREVETVAEWRAQHGSMKFLSEGKVVNS